MTLARLKAPKKTLKAIRATVGDLVNHIVQIANPQTVYLIGSAARDEYTEYSDLDFVVIVADESCKSQAVEKIHLQRPHRHIPVDFIFFTNDEYIKMKDLGGIAFEANHNGIVLYGEKIDS